ncbi:MAG: hypothetical protein ACI4PC_06880 [Oscillospiraceae bacterium]
MSIKKGIDIKLNIKPIFGTLIHDYVFEGPCRFGTGEQLTAEFDRAAAGEGYRKFNENIRKYLSEDLFHFLPPAYIERNEEFIVHEDCIREMTKDDGEADIYLVASSGRIYDEILALAEKVKKPIVTMQFCCNNTMVIAMLRSRGYEAYGYTTWEETCRQLKVLRVRKVMQETTVLLATRGNSTMAPISCSDGFISLEEVTKRLGAHFRYIDIHELLDQITIDDCTKNPTLPSRRGLNLTADELRKIDAAADELIAGAQECTVEKKYVVNSLRANYQILKQMEHMECNAFAAPCPESCATTRLNAAQFTFCANHTLLCEQGIPSACEYDIPGVLAMMMLCNFSMSAPYLGNTVSITLEQDNLTPIYRIIPENGIDQLLPMIDEETRKNLMLTFHSVPGRKLNGFQAPASPYKIHPFTGSGWGATFRHDFTAERGQVLTMARFSPDAKSVFVAKGHIVGSVGHNHNGCTGGVLFHVKDREDFYTKQCEFGNHVPLVYGDYVEEVKTLAALMGLRIVEA